MFDYWNYDGLGLAQLVKAGQVSPLEILDSAFALIDALNPSLNAIVRPMEEEARKMATAGLEPGPFCGVPMVLKDEYISCAGVPCDHASALGAGFVRQHDSWLVQAYRSAGCQIIGKANLPELGASVTSESRHTGPANNPWNLAHNTGGSSGGSAAAVASGIVPFAYSNDGAGSIRIPASCCGVFGLKPTRARVSTAPDGGEYWNGLVIEHAITRSVRDSAALLDLTDTPQAGDYYAAPAKQRPWLEETQRQPGQLRIAFSARPPFDCTIDPHCVAAMEDTARLCESLGHDVSEASPDFDGESMRRNIGNLLCAHLAFGISDFERHFGRTADSSNVEASTLELARRGSQLSATQLLEILESFTGLARQVSGFWQEYDVLLSPTLASPPVPNGFIYTDDPDAERYLQRWFDFVPFTPLANITGNPAMTVPLFWSDQSMPIGTHFTAGFGDEATLFRLAAQLEQARPWKGRTPPISAWSS
ncbi:MAG: amidase family protein [Pseudomonadota bacterium]